MRSRELSEHRYVTDAARPRRVRLLFHAWNLIVRNRLAIAIASLLWLLFRSGSKPQRLAYPCQQVAAANVGVILAGLVPGLFLLRRRRDGRMLPIRVIARRQLIAASLIFVAAWVGVESIQFAQEMVPPEMPTAPLRETASVPTQVGVAQRHIDHGETFTTAEIEALVRTAVHRAGGLDGVISPGDSVVLKPNLVTAGFTGADGVVTDVRVMAAVVKLAWEAGAGSVMIAEGTGATKSAPHRQVTWEAYVAAGYDTNGNHLFDYDENVTLHDLNDAGGLNPNPPQNCTLVSISNGVIRNEYWVPNILLNADVMISVPIFKNHSNGTITLSLKNRVGCAPSDIYHGLNDWGAGVMGKMGLVHNIDEGWPATVPPLYPSLENEIVQRTIVDLNLVRPQDFVVMDALTGVMNGPAPWEGSDIPPGRMRMIIAGRDSVAVDTVGALAMMYDPEYVPHVKLADSRSVLGTYDRAYITPVGDPIPLVRYPFPEGYSGNYGPSVRSESNPPWITGTSVIEGQYLADQDVITGSGIGDDNGAVQAAAQFTRLGPNLVVNGDFETGDGTGWTTWRTGWGTNEAWDFASTEPGRAGAYCLKLGQSNTASSFGVYQEVAVDPGKTYRVDAYWRGQKLSNSNWFEVILLDGAFDLAAADTPPGVQNNFMYAYDPGTYGLPGPIGTTFGWIWTHEQNAPPSDRVDWNERRGRRTASGNTLTVVLKGGTGTGNGVAVWFDEVRLQEVQQDYLVGHVPHPTDPFNITIDASSLPEGDHEGELRLAVYDAALNEAALYRNVKLSTCPQDPWVCLAPISFSHTIHIGDPVPDDLLEIWNCGCDAGSLSYSISDGVDWLQVMPDSGISPENPPSSNWHDVVYDVSMLDPSPVPYQATIVVNGSHNAPTVAVSLKIETVKPDFDFDGDVDLNDFGGLQDCLAGDGTPAGAGCLMYDLNGDQAVGQADVARFEMCMEGSNILPDRTCDDGF